MSVLGKRKAEAQSHPDYPAWLQFNGTPPKRNAKVVEHAGCLLSEEDRKALEYLFQLKFRNENGELTYVTSIRVVLTPYEPKQLGKRALPARVFVSISFPLNRTFTQVQHVGAPTQLESMKGDYYGMVSTLNVDTYMKQARLRIKNADNILLFLMGLLPPRPRPAATKRQRCNNDTTLSKPSLPYKHFILGYFGEMHILGMILDFVRPPLNMSDFGRCPRMTKTNNKHRH